MKVEKTIGQINVSDYVKWQGKYRGVYFEVCKWKPDYVVGNPKLDDGYTWNYYIFVKPRKLKTNKYANDKKYVDYYKMYKDVDMHGGITHWSRHKTDRLNEVDEIGCDYNHIWDYDEYTQHKIERSLNEVLQDVKDTIDNLPKDLFFNNQ